MAQRRRRRSPPPAQGLAAGERLKRNNLIGSDYSAWGWVGTEVTDASKISLEHRLTTCNLSRKANVPICPNKYAENSRQQLSSIGKDVKTANGELEDDVIVISEDETHECSKKACKRNPNCLNYLGQEIWENDEKARAAFLENSGLGEDPRLDLREPGRPVGLRNLGATCYANAYLQVWFQDLAFRKGVYNCQPSQDTEHKFEEAPIFQLQVTFAALQEGIGAVFNPSKLVESLRLRTSEQQDAQEFSKLFMSHLDSEFQKQSDPSLKSLVADQFQGKQLYGTMCENCNYRSERTSDFLELEISFGNNAKLEDCISSLLQPERLSGDNQYSCSQCMSLQDATRYTELRELPPVLHFSLMRFVYDLSTMERKKSKNVIRFPETLDMSQFLGSSNRQEVDGHSDSAQGVKNKHVYKLRGVLLHRGSSAYHGHYEAQVFDISDQTWYQFNDENVTEIKTLHPAPDKEKAKRVAETQEKSSSEKGRPSKKRRVAAGSDEDVVEVSPPSGQQNCQGGPSSYVSSKDAYMLVYTRQDADFVPEGNTSDCSVPSPPARAMEAVNDMNSKLQEAIEQFETKQDLAISQFEETRQKVREIYKSWNISSFDDPSVVVSQQAFQAWLTACLGYTKDAETNGESGIVDPPASPKAEDEKMGADTSTFENGIIPCKEIICSHGLLDPDKAGNMKRVKAAAYEKIFSDTGYVIVPALVPESVCETCVMEGFAERLYRYEHPRIVAEFDIVCDDATDESGFWISKLWLKDWRLSVPKMHTSGQPDPPPDAPDYKGHVFCEHDNLSPSSALRRKTSVKGYHIVKSLYPQWNPLSSEAEPCAICETMVHMSKADKLEMRRKAEDEKAKLKHMHDNALNGNTWLLENTPCAIISSEFIRSWRRWLSRPAEYPRPIAVDNTAFLCEHHMLVLDPNSPTDVDESVCLIKMSDWNMLTDLYPAGPMIMVENCTHQTEDGTISFRFRHDLQVCHVCRLHRKLQFEVTEVTVRLLGPEEPVPCENAQDGLQLMDGSCRQTSILEYTNAGRGTRQSKRLRQMKEHGERRRVVVSKTMTLRDIKMKLQDKFGIPTISQRLFYQGTELEDNTATVAALEFLVNDTIYLRGQRENGAVFDSDVDVIDVGKKPREEGLGFGGTLLSGYSSAPPSSPEPESRPQQDQKKSCSLCTFENVWDSPACTMCEAPFH